MFFSLFIFFLNDSMRYMIRLASEEVRSFLQSTFYPSDIGTKWWKFRIWYWDRSHGWWIQFWVAHILILSRYTFILLACIYNELCSSTSKLRVVTSTLFLVFFAGGLFHFFSQLFVVGVCGYELGCIKTSFCCLSDIELARTQKMISRLSYSMTKWSYQSRQRIWLLSTLASLTVNNHFHGYIFRWQISLPQLFHSYWTVRGRNKAFDSLLYYLIKAVALLETLF